MTTSSLNMHSGGIRFKLILNEVLVIFLHTLQEN
jgi:hypothetical protein